MTDQPLTWERLGMKRETLGGGASEQPEQPASPERYTPRESDVQYYRSGAGAWNEGMASTGYSYWELPGNVAMHKQAQDAAPPDTDFGRYGWDRDFVNQAYDYMQQANGGTPWWEWKPLAGDDPYRQDLIGAGAPPPESQYRPGKIYEWQVPAADKVQAAPTMADDGFPAMGTPAYEALPSWQKLMRSVMSSGALSGIETMLPWAAFTALTGGIGGLIALPSMLAGGAALGQFTSEQTFAKIKAGGGWASDIADPLQSLAQKTFMLLNWPTERLEQLVGTATQISQYGGPSTTALDFLTLNKIFDLGWNDAKLAEAATQNESALQDVLGNLESAWQAGRLAYEASGATWFGQLANIPAGVEYLWDQITTGETDVVFAKPGEVWVLGQREPVKLDRSAMGILNAARQEIAEGANWYDVYTKYQSQLGFSGQITDLFAQSLADPLNVAPMVEAKGLQLFGRAVGNPVLVKAATQALHRGEGLVGARRMYRVLLPTEISPTRMTPGQLKLAGLNEQGQYTNLTPSRGVSDVAGRVREGAITFGESPFSPQSYVGFVRNLFDLTPDSRYKAMLEMTHDTAGLVLGMGEGDPKEMYRHARAWKELDIREAAGVAEILGMPEAQTAKQGFGGVDVDALEKAWDMGAAPRRVLDNVSGALGETRAKVLDMIHEASKGNTAWADTLATRIQELAAQRGKTGMLGPEFSGRQLASAMSYFEANWWAADPAAARAVLHNKIIDSVSDWGLAAYGVKPGGRVERMASGLKGVQSLLLLGFNPAYKINNDISNTVGALSEGVFGMASDATIRRFFDEFGVDPYRLRAGIGAADIEIRPDVTGRSLTDEQRLRQAFEQGGRAAVEQEGIQSAEVREREARRAGDTLQAAQDVVARTGRLGVVQQWAGKAEQSASARAMYYGVKQAFTRLWPSMIPDMPRDLQARLDGIDPRLADTLRAIAERSTNPKAMAAEINRALGGKTVRRAVEDYVSDTAQAMGISPADLREMLDTTGVSAEVNRRLTGGATVTDAFSGAMERTRGWLDQKLQADLIAKAQDSQARVSSEGFVAALDLMKDLQFKLEEVWTRHFAMWEETYRQAADLSGGEYNTMIRSRATEARAQWRAYRQWERATWAGVLRELGFGEGKAASHEARLFMKLQKGLHESWGRFFEITSARYESYYDRMQAEKWDKKRRSAEWQKLQQELSDLYIEYAVKENKYNDLLGYAFVKMFGEQYGAGRSVGAVEWWQSTKSLSTERQEMMRAFRAWERGAMNEVRRPDVLEVVKDLDPMTQKHTAWPQFLSKLYLPLIGQVIKGGMDSAHTMMEMENLAPDTDIIARYNQTLEELRQQGYRPGAEVTTETQRAQRAQSVEEAPSIQMMITRDMRQQLADLGYRGEDVRNMAPEEAARIIQAGEMAPEASLKADRNRGLMGPRDRLADADLPDWFTSELSDRMAAWANDLYTTLPFGEDVVTIIKTQTQEDTGGEFEGAYRSTSNPPWYTEWNEQRKAAGMPELDKDAVGGALRRIMQDEGADAIRFGEATIERVKQLVIEHAERNGDDFFSLYQEGTIAGAIGRGDLDEAARIYNAWVTSEEIGQRMTREDLALIAGGADNLRAVEDAWARDEWQANLEARYAEQRDPLMERAWEAFERKNLAQPFERTNDEAVQEAVERIADQVMGDDWVRGMDEDTAVLDSQATVAQTPMFESWGEFDGLVDRSKPMPNEEFDRVMADFAQESEVNAAIADVTRRYDMADVEQRKQALIELFKFTDEQADAELLILERAAQVWATRTGQPMEMFWHGTSARQGGQGGELPGGAAEIQAMVGGYPRGAFEVLDNTSKMIWALDRADMDTWLHESAHMFYSLADVETRTMIDEKFGGNTDDFADGYTRWRAYGEAPSGTIKAAFENFRGFVKDMLRRVARVMQLPESWAPGRPLDPEMERVYKRLFEIEPHEMSGPEFAIKPDDPDFGGMTPRQRLDEHPKLVLEAVREGKPVDDQIIMDYPGIKTELATEIEPGKPTPLDVMAAAGDVPKLPPRRSRAKKPAQAEQIGMFGAGEDLPLFSGTAQRGEAETFDTAVKEMQPGLPGMTMRPEMAGAVEAGPERLGEMMPERVEPVVEAPARDFATNNEPIVRYQDQMVVSSRYVGKLLERLGITADLLTQEYYRKVENPPYIDLVIETHRLDDGSAMGIYLTHYVEQNGDWMIDTEMIYGNYGGQLIPLEYAYRGPWGEVRIPARGNERQFNMFAKNLLDQGFDKAKLVDPRAQEAEVQAAQAPREQQLVETILDRLAQGVDWEKQRDFESLAEGMGFNLREEADLNLMYDLFEGALNMYARKVRSEMGGMELAERLEGMQNLENRLMQARRTISKSKLQQFSTPLTISEAAMAAADVRAGDTVGEPTAGTANLVDGFYGRNDVAVRVNEIDPGRQAVLSTIGYEPSGLDVLSKDWVIGADGKLLGSWADVMIINPPWGAYSKGIYGKPVDAPVKGMNDWSQRFTHLIMQRLAQGGRLVIVAPTNWVYTKSRTTGQYTYKRSEYLKWLDNNAHVRAVIESPAGAYDTRATGVGSLLIVIDKTTPALRQAGVEAFGERAPADWRAYAGLVDQVGKRGEGDVTTAHARTANAERVEPARPATGPDATGLVDPAARRGEARGDPAAIGRMEPAAESAGVPEPGAIERGGAGGGELEPGPVGAVGERVEPIAGEGGGVAPAVVAEQPAPVPERVPERVRELSEVVQQSIERSKGAVAASRNFTLYEPRAPLRPDDVTNPHPTAVVETKGLSGVAYPKLEEAYRPSDGVMGALRRRVISTEGNLDPVWAAIQQNEKHGSAMVVADDVGMGKSRTAGAYVLDRIEKGRKKILVITKGQQNVDNLKNVEFPGVWGGEVNDFGAWVSVPDTYLAQRVEISGATLPEVKRGEAPLPVFDEAAVYFIAENNVSAFYNSLLEARFDCVVVDEAHLFKNADTQKGYAWLELHKDWLRNNTDMLYLTATPGTDVMDLQYLYGLRVWSVDGFGDWIKIITGEESVEGVAHRQEAQGAVSDYATALERARNEVSYVPVTITMRWGGDTKGVRVGDFLIYKDRGSYDIHTREEGDRLGSHQIGSLKSETEAIIVAGIATREGLGIYDARQAYIDRFPSISKTDIRNAGYTDASDIQKRVDKGSWGKEGKRSAWDTTLTPAHTENIMREMKLGGYYMARDISRAGVEFNVKEYLPVKEMQQKLARRIQLYREIIQAFNEFGKANKGPKKAAALFGVNGDIQGDIKRALFDIRLQGAIEEAKAAVARGEKVVISTISVSEVEGGGKLLENAIGKINTNQVDKLGEGQYSNPVEIPEALIKVVELREAAAELGGMASPMDILAMQFPDRIGFVTGAQSAQERARVNKAFQNDELDVVLISGAGKTGINLHDVTGKRVHLIVADYEWSPTTFKQELGRVDRTGQKTSPIVSVLHTGTAGERKFVATIANRMKGLGAVSKGEGESTGTGALNEEFEFGSQVDRLAMANTWALIGPEYRNWFLDKYFNDPQTPEVKRSSIPTTSEGIQKFLIAFQSMPREIGNEIYKIFEQEKIKMLDSELANLDEAARAQRNMGEILRETDLDTNLRLTEVRANDGTKYGIVSGVMTPVMNRLRNVIEPNYERAVMMEGQRAQQWMRWTQFYDAKKNQYVSGIVVRLGKIKSVAEAWGQQAGGGYKPETALTDILAGDKIPVHGAENAEWKLYLGSGGYRTGMIVIEGAKMAQRDALLNNGAKFDARGTFFYVEAEKLQDFLKRFPIRDVAPEQAKTLYQWAVPEEGESAVPRPTPEAAAASQAVSGPSVMPLPRALNVEMGGRSWRVVGFVFDGGKFAAYVPERFSNLQSFKVEDKRTRLLGFNERAEWVYTLDDGKLYTQPMEVNERPAAAGPLALGTLEASGAAPTYHSEIQNEGYQNWVMPALDDMQARMRADERNPVRTSGVDENTAKQVRGWLSQVEQKMPVAKSTALKLGYAKRDAALINYSKRRNIDTYLGMIYPYQFWMTRNAANWAMRQMDRPAWASQMARLAQFMRTYEDDRPSRMKGRFYMPQAWLPEWAGGGLWYDPMSKLFPHSELLRPLDYFAQSQNRAENIAIGYLRDWAKSGEITTEEAEAASKGKSGTVWERALAMAKQNEGSDWTDYMSLFTSPATYLTLPYKIATGKAKELSPFPASRFIQGLATATGADWLKNLDVEATLRDKLGYSKFGQFGDYYVERQLANMAIEGLITPEEASRAMIERNGEAYAQALARVEQEQMLKNPGLASVYAMRQAMQGKAGLADVVSSLMTTALPGYTLPQGELIYRGLVQEYNAAWAEFNKTGDKSAVTQFYEDHPEYQARQALYNTPEDRIKYYLINQVWDSYAALPALHKRQAREQLGEQFEQDFLNKDTQNYEALSAEQLAGWARLLGGQGLEGMGEGALARPLELAGEEITGTYQTYNQEKAAKFPGIDRVLDAYYNADKTQQDAMRKMYPAIDQYYNWRYQFMADNPDIIEHIVGEDSSLAGLKPEVARWMAQYYADRGSMFRDIFTTQDAYYALEKNQRKGYLKDHPELEQYWTWRRSFQAQHPEIIPFVNSVEKVAEGVLGKDYKDSQATGVDLQALPKDIQQDLFGYAVYGSRMPNGSYSYLRYQWEHAGRPMSSFNTWLGALVGR